MDDDSEAQLKESDQQEREGDGWQGGRRMSWEIITRFAPQGPRTDRSERDKVKYL